MHFRLVACSCRRTMVLCTGGERRDKPHEERATSVAMAMLALQSSVGLTLLIAPGLKPSFFPPRSAANFRMIGQHHLGRLKLC